MAELPQSEDTLKYYIGWYGQCSDELLCANFDLTFGTTRDKIFKVYQINNIGDNYAYFDGMLTPDLDQLQGFTELLCGHAYLIVLKEGEGVLDIPGFVHTNSEDEEIQKYLTASCENQDLLPQQELVQSRKALTYYLGWYGGCGEPCEDFDLSPVHVRSKLFRVFQINKFNDNYTIFEPTYTQKQDALGLQGFTKMECGKMYLMVLEMGDAVLELDNFTYTKIDSDDSGRIIDECLTGPRGLQPGIPRVELLPESIDIFNDKWYDTIEEPKADADLFNVNLNSNNEIEEDVSVYCGKSVKFDGVMGGYANLGTYKEKLQVMTMCLEFTIEGNVGNREIGEANKNSQYLVFQQNQRKDEKDGGFYIKYLENEDSETQGRLEAGVYKNNGTRYYIKTNPFTIVTAKRYMVFFVISKTMIYLYLDGDLVGTMNKTPGIDYHETHTIHLGRKRPIGTIQDAYYKGKVHRFIIWAESLGDDFIYNYYLQNRCKPPIGVVYKSCEYVWNPPAIPRFQLDAPTTRTRPIGVVYKVCKIGASDDDIELPTLYNFEIPPLNPRPTTIGVKYEGSNCGNTVPQSTITSYLEHLANQASYSVPPPTNNVTTWNPTDPDANILPHDNWGAK